MQNHRFRFWIFLLSSNIIINGKENVGNHFVLSSQQHDKRHIENGTEVALLTED